MSSLRELSTDLRAINDMANDPDIAPEMLIDTIEGLEGMFEEKAIRVVHVVANNESDISEIDEEIKRLQGKKKIMVNAKDRLKEYLRFNMEASGVTKITSPLFNITLAKGSDSVQIDDETLLPDDYVKMAIIPDKTLIGKAIKDGYNVPGASLSTGNASIRIK
jgi:hypothetical protein